MTDSKTTLGPLVRLEGISTSKLPLGGKGVESANAPPATEKYIDGSGSTAAPNLTDFITNILAESIPFIDGVAPKDGSALTWKVKGSPKRFGFSEAPVHLYERVVSAKELNKPNPETWFCRKSCHRNTAEKGSASWEEFKHSFKDHHAETEYAFTPTVIGARQAMSWDTSGIEVNVHGGQWTNITMVVEEMKHKIDPKPLKNRTFPVLHLSATLVGVEEFLVVSIPINDFHKSLYAEFARDKSLVMAAYTAIERIRVLPSNGDIEWIMATASDAGGVLPQWVQNLAVPGAIAKDVDMFMSWIPNQRTAEGKPEKELPDAPIPSDNGAPQPISKTEPQPGMTQESSDKELPAAPVQ